MTGSMKVVSAISRLGTHSKPSSARPGAEITLAAEKTDTCMPATWIRNFIGRLCIESNSLCWNASVCCFYQFSAQSALGDTGGEDRSSHPHSLPN